MPLYPDDVPVAFSMMGFIHDGRLEGFQFNQYCCAWMAFNNIYAYLAEGTKHAPRLTGRDNLPVGGIVVPKVRNGSERGQIAIAVRWIPPALQDRLLVSREAEYFVNRTPKLRGELKPRDPNGQRLNGVMNVGHSIATGQLIWTPIDRTGYERYRAGDHDKRLRRDLVRQLVMVLYSVRNNLFHGGKGFEDDNDHEVIQHALPLLKQLVAAYIGGPP